MKRMLLRNCFREIHKARNRFLSILAITALGVGFFAGIRSTSPDMRLGADQYYDEHRLMDVKLLSSLGFTQADQEALCALPEVEQAQLSYSSDAIVSNGEKNVVIKVMGLSKDWEEGINVPWLLEGRMPESPGECIVDKADFVGEAFSLGSTVTLQSGNPDKPISDTFLRETYTVVGFFKSPMYVSFDKGTSSVGDGSVRYLMMVPEENFSLDAYTELYLTASGAAEEDSYEDEYTQLVDALLDALEPVEEIRTQQRLEEVTGDAKQEIADAEKELEDGKKTQQEEIAKAEQEIADAKQQLAEVEEEYAKGQQDLEKKLADARKKLEDGGKKYQEGLTAYQENQQKYQDGVAEAEEGWKSANEAEEQLDRSEKELGESAAQVEQGLGQVEDALAQIQVGLSQIDSGETLLSAARLLLVSPGYFSEQQKAAIVMGLGSIDSGLQAAMQSYLDGQMESAAVNIGIDAAFAQLTSQRSSLESQQSALEIRKHELQTAQKQLASGAAQIAQGRQEIQQAKEQLNQVERQLEEAAKQLEEGRLELENARAELEDGWSEYSKGKAEGEQKLADARKELDDGYLELADAEQTLQEEREKSDQEIADGEREITDAKQELADLEKPEWHCLERSFNPGYTDYVENTDKIAAISKVFPVLFFAVAALVCLTSMTRMVEEYRTQNGTMKALGYGPLSILSYYLIYALLATLLGCVLGFSIGFWLFPFIISNAYGIMYSIPPVPFVYWPDTILLCALIAVACTTIPVMFAVLGGLRETPASLMRPKTPKPGKRILLERIPFIWNHLNFSKKVTARNLFRYKKKLLMTVIGVAGCTALVLTGFGIKDSITSITDLQFGELFLYHGAAALEEPVEVDQQVDLSAYPQISDSMRTYQSTTEASSQKGKQAYSVTLMVPAEPEELAPYVVLRERVGHASLSLSNQGVIINEKLAELLKIQTGDKITIGTSGETQVLVQVTGITENYAMNYVYMTPTLYQQLYQDTLEYNSVIFHLVEDTEENEGLVTTAMLDSGDYLSVTMLSKTNSSFRDVISILNSVVVVLVLSAAVLGFVVLYNLSAINISERVREIATLKVLGLYPSEVTGYIGRESAILTLIGTILGLLAGMGLHRYIMDTLEVDFAMFGKEIYPLSYLYAFLLTAAFAAIVQFVVHFSLKKVKMVESLKSIE